MTVNSHNITGTGHKVGNQNDGDPSLHFVINQSMLATQDDIFGFSCCSCVDMSCRVALLCKKERDCNCDLTLDSSHGDMGKGRLSPPLTYTL